jgi:long-chain acyl-CoA synthetase
MSVPACTTLVDLYQHGQRSHSDNPLFGTRTGGGWSWITYGEFGERTDAFRAGLADLGIGRGDTVAIISANRVEWAIAAYATYGLGARLAPMYEHQRPTDWEFIVRDSEAKVLIASTSAIFEQARDWPSTPGGLRLVLGMDLAPQDPRSFAHVEQVGRAAPVDPVAVEPDEICGFIYTSGTTGDPKGVLLSHRNIASNVRSVLGLFPLAEDDCSLSFLPWAHSFGQTCELHCLYSMGARTALSRGVDQLLQEFSEVRPSILFSVPRVFNQIHQGLQQRLAAKGPLSRGLFRAALDNAAHRQRLAARGARSSWADLKHRVYEMLVFRKVRAAFGGNLKYAFSGGAALSPQVAEFIDRLGILVFEGYGLTETGPIATANAPGRRRIGSVGKAIPGVEVRIEAAEDVEDDSGDGEVVIAGPNVMKGYHNLPQETAAVMTADGAFRSGDRGRLDADGYLYITGRIKEQYKLESGRYVVPAPLEEELQLSPWIDQAFVHGSNRPHNVALIVPDRQTVLSWARKEGLRAPFEGLLEEQRVRKRVGEAMEAQSAAFRTYERPRSFALLAEGFRVDNGLLTPTLKIKRRAVVQRHGELLERLYP